MNKKRIAVFFGGRSPEHDVSVVSALQALQAIDETLYEAFPVYITPDGEWVTGDILRTRATYMLTTQTYKDVTPVTLDITAGERARLLPKKFPLFGQPKPIEFDAAFLGFHGSHGEDGHIQGLFELADVPYTGTRAMASSVFMDKVTTKRILNDLDIPTLPYAVLHRPSQGSLIPEADIKKALGKIKCPVIVKPVHLGSSIGVAKAKTIPEIAACLPTIFEFDTSVIIEPFVENLVEYNVAVTRVNGDIQTSALERPKSTDELLDFKQKYLSGGGSKSGTKTSGTKSPGQTSEGMLSLTRELNPKLKKKTEKDIRRWAALAFEALDGTGAPRMDFLGNKKTGEVWFNEVNPIPGSFGYFLWEALPSPLLFTDLLTGLIKEAFQENKKRKLPKDPVPVDARLLTRRR